MNKKTVLIIVAVVLVIALAAGGYWYFCLRVPLAADGGLAVPYISQLDYTNTVCTVDGKKRSVKSSGCGPTCIAMADAFFNGEKNSHSPEELFAWAYENHFYFGSGIGHDGMDAMADLCGFHGEWTGEEETIRQALQDHHIVIAHMGPGEFTSFGHYILLRGLDSEGLVIVNDPSSAERSEKHYELSLIKKQLRMANACMILENGKA